jgi:hypothetical protein
MRKGGRETALFAVVNRAEKIAKKFGTLLPAAHYPGVQSSSKDSQGQKDASSTVKGAGGVFLPGDDFERRNASQAAIPSLLIAPCPLSAPARSAGSISR